MAAITTNYHKILQTDMTSQHTILFGIKKFSKKKIVNLKYTHLYSNFLKLHDMGLLLSSRTFLTTDEKISRSDFSIFIRFPHSIYQRTLIIPLSKFFFVFMISENFLFFFSIYCRHKHRNNIVSCLREGKNAHYYHLEAYF